MVKADFYEDRVELIGHADYYIEGFDIVCAAITAVTQTFVIGAYKHCRGAICVADRGPGDLHIRINSSTAELELLIDCFYEGLKAIEDLYPDNIRTSKH